MSFWDDELEEGGSGGVQTITGVVTDAFFSENEVGTSLKLTIVPDDLTLHPNFKDGTYTMFFPCGKGWSTKDLGVTVEHDDGPDKKYRKDTDIGRLFEALKKVEGLREAAPNFNPYSSASYKGLHLNWARVPVAKRKVKRDENGEQVMNDQGRPVFVDATVLMLLPVSLAGGVVAPVAEKVDLDTLGLTAEQVQELAKASDSDKGLTEAILKAGLASNTALMTAVSKNMAGLRAALGEAEIL